MIPVAFLMFIFVFICQNNLVGVANSYLQKGCLTLFLHQTMECSHELEHSPKEGSVFWNISFGLSWGLWYSSRCLPAVGLEAALGLNLLGTALFLFSAALSSLMLGLVSGSRGLNWLVGIGPMFPSTSRKVFIFFIIVFHGVPWCTLDQLGCLVLPEYVCPLHGHDLYFYIYHCHQEFVSKVTMQKVAFWLE